jgi:hypothetical protein
MFREAEKLIKTRLSLNWDISPIDFDNVTFHSEMGEPFIRLQIDWVNVERRSISNKSRKGEGFILISVFVPSNLGTATAFEWADLIAVIFDNYRVDSLKFGVGRPQRIGDNKGWFQININTPFYFNECI